MLFGVVSTTKVEPCFTSLYHFWSLMFCSGNIHQPKWLCSIECSWQTNVLHWLKKRNWQKVFDIFCVDLFNTGCRINTICNGKPFSLVLFRGRLLEHCTGAAEVMGLNLFRPEFFSGFISQLFKLCMMITHVYILKTVWNFHSIFFLYCKWPCS